MPALSRTGEEDRAPLIGPGSEHQQSTGLDFAPKTLNNRRKPGMSVEQPDVIDFVARDPKTDDTLLVMVEVRDWASSPIAVQQLETKLAAYSEFILSGALTRQFPEATNRPIRIQLDHFRPIADPVATKLREWSGKLSALSVSGPPTGQETERCQSECREWRQQSYGTGPDFN